MNQNILVAYFSASGVTADAARRLADAANADLFEIEPAKPYTEADLDWTNPNSRSTVEMRDACSRPEIASKIENFDRYDLVFVGFPIWWYVAPSIIDTFLESYDFAGKTVVPFATSGGSGFGNTVKNLRAHCASGTIWGEAKMLNDNISAGAMKSWIDQVTKQR